MKYSSFIVSRGGMDCPKRTTIIFRILILCRDTSRLVVERTSFNCIRPIPFVCLWGFALPSGGWAAIETAGGRYDKGRAYKTEEEHGVLGAAGDALISNYDIDISAWEASTAPIINPLLLSYSHRNGISYRGIKYNKLFHDGRLLRIVPQIGYNFTKFYTKADMEYIYNPRKLGSIEYMEEMVTKFTVVWYSTSWSRFRTIAFYLRWTWIGLFKDVYVIYQTNI